MISIIHPSRSRYQKSHNTFDKWFTFMDNEDFDSVEWIGSFDADDPHLQEYKKRYSDFDRNVHYVVRNNRSCVDAINNAVSSASGNILLVVSDDTDCFPGWDTALLKEVEGKTDWCLKTNDGIQDYIITMPCMDRAYYNRTGYIYHPDFFHMFADTYMTCVADITGRKITSTLQFKHNHPGHSGGKETTDALNTRNDLSWKEGQDTFIRLMKQFSKSDIQKIKDRSMIRFLRNNGVQV